MKKRTKRIMALGLSVMMCFSVAACGGGTEDTSQGGGESNQASADNGGGAADTAEAPAEDSGSDSGDKVITF